MGKMIDHEGPGATLSVAQPRLVRRGLISFTYLTEPPLVCLQRMGDKKEPSHVAGNDDLSGSCSPAANRMHLPINDECPNMFVVALTRL